MPKSNFSVTEYSAYHLPFYGVIAFIIFNLIAMWNYPGGTYQNSELETYMFTQNYFSDLGRTMTMNNTQNFYSAFVFNLSLTMIGLLMSLFYFYLPNLFRENSTAHNFARIASIIAVTSGIAFAGVGFTPSDLYLDEHMFFVKWAFRSFLIVAILFIVAIYQAPEWKIDMPSFILVLQLYYLAMYLLWNLVQMVKKPWKDLYFRQFLKK